MAYLECVCESGDFVAIVKLKTSAVGGIVPEVAGYACLSCKEKADTGMLLKRLELRRKAAELTELEADIARDKEMVARKPEKKVVKSEAKDLPPSPAGPSVL